MTYTTHGLMTAADMADMRNLYDLNLCPCCEAEGLADEQELRDGLTCSYCGHESDAHV